MIFYSDVIAERSAVPFSLLTRKPSFWFDRAMLRVTLVEPANRQFVGILNTDLKISLSIEVSFLKGRKEKKIRCVDSRFKRVLYV